jgi:hypothetical protein
MKLRLFGKTLALCSTGFVLLAWTTLHAGQFAGTPIDLGAAGPNSSLAWGDFDDAGLLDIALSGTVTGIWRNQGDNTFSNINATVSGAAGAKVAWADLDNDGRVDLIIAGASQVVQPVLNVYRNTAQGFTLMASFPTGIPVQTFAVGDFDNDGLPDILLVSDAATSGIYRNVGAFGFSRIVYLSVPAATLTTDDVLFCDFDSDGWPDVALPNSFDGTLHILRNLYGTNLTSLATNAFSPSSTLLKWADFNNDGRPDLVFGNTTVMDVLLNTGGSFMRGASITVGTPSFRPSIAAGDFDNDGWVDLYANPRIDAPVFQRNNHDGTFSAVDAGYPADTTILNGRAAAFGDFDNDGKLDLAVTHHTPDGSNHLYIRRNVNPSANTPPTAPSGLLALTQYPGTTVTLRWSPASDAQTPAAGLSYNLRVGTTPGGSDVVSPMSDPVSGTSRCAAFGNAYQRTFAFLQKLTMNRTYYWSVQAIDSAYAAGPWAPEAHFTTSSPGNGDADGDGIVDQSELLAVFANYLRTSPYLLMTNNAGLGGTNVTFSLGTLGGIGFSVESSTNLSDWNYLGQATFRYSFGDTNATGAATRYYRLRYP